ncbi:MFS transporter [Oryzobacter telluris]|uniref:MFS transporter n=1 Tax=Oryzobacter telluris TaxID=3149179 RepID=UPI00370D792E
MPAVDLAPYRRALTNRPLRTALVLGTLVRGPIFASGLLLTVHVVSTLGRTYAEAGLVSAAATIAIAVSGPWRGRLLDRLGLRRVVLPSVLVALGCWSVAPFVGYLPLLVLAVVAGLFVIPTFSVIRQAVIAAVPDTDRRSAISLDAAAIELSFMIVPALAVWAASQWPSSWVLFVTQMLGVAGGVALYVVNPPMRHVDEEVTAPGTVAFRSWFGWRFVAVLLTAAATTVVLFGTDLGVVAVMREAGTPAQIGVVLALWGFGSLVGGLLYGALHRPIPAAWLLAGLALVTAPMALAHTTLTLSALALVAGLLCAPTITATIDQASRAVPPAVRGEAMGWHGSAMTAGGAVGAPLAGFAIDQGGGGAGFVTVAVVGLVVALLGVGASGALRRSRTERGAQASPV